MAKENQFINALKNSDTQEIAFNKLLSDYKERLYWHVRKIVIDHDDANDVLQNTFIKVFDNINSFKQNSSIYTWMFRIATNESLNYINKKAKKIGISNEEWIAEKSDKLKYLIDCTSGNPEITTKIGENLNFVVSCKNLFFKRDFSITHRQTHRLHSWIGLDLI